MRAKSLIAAALLLAPAATGSETRIVDTLAGVRMRF
jgi:hypothetical protein